MEIVIPYVGFLYFYLAVIVCLLLFGASSLYHLLKFGFFSPTSITMTFVMLAGTAFILFVSYEKLSPIDWGQTFDILSALQDINPL